MIRHPDGIKPDLVGQEGIGEGVVPPSAELRDQQPEFHTETFLQAIRSLGGQVKAREAPNSSEESRERLCLLTLIQRGHSSDTDAREIILDGIGRFIATVLSESGLVVPLNGPARYQFLDPLVVEAELDE